MRQGPTNTSRYELINNNDALLYQLKKDDKISYLFGTIHYKTPDALLPMMRYLAKECSELVIEHHWDFNDLLRSSAFYNEKGDGVLPPTLLDDPKVKKIGEYLRENGKDIHKLTPLGLVTILLSTKSTPTNALTMEEMLRYKMSYSEKTLETFSELVDIGYFGELSIGEMDKAISDMQDVDVHASIEAESEIYSTTKLSVFTEHLKMCVGNEMFLHQTVARNKLWSPKIAKIHSESRTSVGSRTVFAVGAAHLLGDSGLLALLKADGFEVNGIVVRDNTFDLATYQKNKTLFEYSLEDLDFSADELYESSGTCDLDELVSNQGLKTVEELILFLRMCDSKLSIDINDAKSVITSQNASVFFSLCSHHQDIFEYILELNSKDKFLNDDDLNSMLRTLCYSDDNVELIRILFNYHQFESDVYEQNFNLSLQLSLSQTAVLLNSKREGSPNEGLLKNQEKDLGESRSLSFSYPKTQYIKETLNDKHDIRDEHNQVTLSDSNMQLSYGVTARR